MRICGIVAALSLGVASTASASVVEGFNTSTVPQGWELGGDALLSAGTIDPENDGWLRLTSAVNDELGYAISTDPVDTSTGLLVAFDFVSWGGNGADGFSVFLWDQKWSQNFGPNTKE